ncbi:hypothetical protein B0H21DRAFT_546035 [Amylocystis lapponica]|nr:hypothetical protein B0H21DRAFT_546035 [Amylocystis lapponica]
MLLSNASSSRRPSIHNRGSSSFSVLPEIYSDSRTHGYQGPTRHVRFPRATSNGGGAIAKSEDGVRCVVAGKESLRILRMVEPTTTGFTTEHKVGVGRGGHIIEASRNLWEGSGLKIDSASTDVIWGHGIYSNKILTSARNGELIMWDLNKSGSSKYERRARVHTRSIHALAYSSLVQYYCMTGSADGEIRVWDMRTDLSKYVIRIRHPASVRAVSFSPIHWQPLHAVSALDNGSIYRWDLNMGQRGQLDRIPVAHAGPILALDWSVPPSSAQTSTRHSAQSSWYGSSSGSTGLLDDILPVAGSTSTGDGEGNGAGWLVSGGLDRSVKVWDLTAPSAKTHISHNSTYHLRTAFPVRRVLWRPGYECELAIVSNADFGTSSSMDLPPSTVGSVGALAQPLGLGSGLASAISSPRIPTASITVASEDTHIGAGDRGPSVTRNDGSDPIEIWDVRRSYIAKWVLTQSSVEGGVTDMVFADSQAIWAQHSSGTFSQLDLRQSCKPLDSVPRMAISWEASGSLLFVTDKPKRWDIPFDDIKAEQVPTVQERHKIKALGDPVYVPASQSVGTVAYDGSDEDFEIFVKLAQGYIYEGVDRISVCGHNAQVARVAGKPEAAQTWLMLETLMTNLAPETPPTPPQAFTAPSLPHSISAPAGIPTVYSIPTPRPARSLSAELDVYMKHQKDSSPGSRSRHSDDKTGIPGYQSPLAMTPTSSNASSPRRPNSSLPVTPLPSALLARRESNSMHAAMRPRLPSSFRRPSFSSPSIYSVHSESPSDSTKSHSNLRHVGEGALDDSDSSGSDGGEENGIRGSKSDSGDEDPPSARVPVSPRLYPRGPAANPSPLSRVTSQQTWTEDEKEDEDSPSPASTSDSESDGSLKRSVSRATRKSSARSKTRSRSSTVASLAVSISHRPLEKQVSHSSIRTVTAGNTPTGDAGQAGGLRRDDTLRDMHRERSVKSSPHHNRGRSEALSSEFLLDFERHPNGDGTGTPSSDLTSRDSARAIRAAEHGFRDLGWEALREALEFYADQGDVQICAFLSVVAPKELRIKKLRAMRFMEAYIDILSRLRLHTSAAYMRKFIEVEEIRSTTAMQTTIYTSCGRCRKPILFPASASSETRKPSGNFAYCTSCKSNNTTCSICHLPVRALLFKCSVCMHGGHQECYRNYYMRRPMVELASAPSVDHHHHPRQGIESGLVPERVRGRAASKSSSTLGGESDGGSDDSTGLRSSEGKAAFGEIGEFETTTAAQTLLGHPCAVGCGHYCWVVRGQLASD